MSPYDGKGMHAAMSDQSAQSPGAVYSFELMNPGVFEREGSAKQEITHRRCHVDLAIRCCTFHPRGEVDGKARYVAVSILDLAGVNTRSHRQIDAAEFGTKGGGGTHRQRR